MRNVDIVYKAKNVVKEQPGLVPVFIFIGILGIVPSIITNKLGILLLTLMMMPIGQGDITVTYKAYYHRADEIQTYEDGLCGLRNWFELFGSYFFL